MHVPCPLCSPLLSSPILLFSEINRIMSTKSILAEFDTWQNSLFATLVKATKAANAIPAGDVSFYRSLDREFARKMDEASASTLELCNGLLKQAGGVEVEELREGDDIKERFDIVVDVVDNVLEKVVCFSLC